MDISTMRCLEITLKYIGIKGSMSWHVQSTRTLLGSHLSTQATKAGKMRASS